MSKRYGLPGPSQVTGRRAWPSPRSQIVRTGVAVAVTSTPPAAALADSGTHWAGSTQSQVEMPTRPTTSRGGAVDGVGAGSAICDAAWVARVVAGVGPWGGPGW